MIRPTELIEKLKVSSQAVDEGEWVYDSRLCIFSDAGLVVDIRGFGRGMDQKIADHVIQSQPNNARALLRWVEVLERALELQEMDSANWKEASIEQAARELEARDDK